MSSQAPGSADRKAALRRRRLGRLISGIVLAAVVASAALISASADDAPSASTSPKPSPSKAAPVACGGERPPAPDPQTYGSPPPLNLEQGVDYSAVITTSCGEITMDLLEDKAPQNVNNFIFLAREGFYDGLTFHRIEQNSVIQGGDPEGTGHGGPGYTVPDELPENPTVYTFGTVAMANDGPNTAGSQFFIVVHDPDPGEGGYDPVGYRPWYSLFGAIDPNDEESVATLTDPKTGIATQDTKVGDDPTIATQPISPVYIESIEILENA